eukprot:1194141-Prorocentrum_minimum.AAC.5
MLLPIIDTPIRHAATTTAVPVESEFRRGRGDFTHPNTPAPGPPHTVRDPPGAHGWLMTPATGLPSTATPNRLVTGSRLPMTNSPVPSRGSM